jgi:hypothetical protein
MIQTKEGQLSRQKDGCLRSLTRIPSPPPLTKRQKGQTEGSVYVPWPEET